MGVQLHKISNSSFQQNGGTTAHNQEFFVSTKWRHNCTEPAILRFNKMAAQLHTTSNSTFQQNGDPTAHHP
jgi:hypothetical protein